MLIMVKDPSYSWDHPFLYLRMVVVNTITGRKLWQKMDSAFYMASNDTRRGAEIYHVLRRPIKTRPHTRPLTRKALNKIPEEFLDWVREPIGAPAGEE